MLVQLVTINVKPGHIAEFEAAFRINYEGTKTEPGNLRFDVLKDPGNDHLYTIYEVFKSNEALEDHRRTDHYKQCVAIIDPIINGKREKTYFTPVMADFL